MTIISWLGSAYLVAVTVIQPLSGKLTDVFGRRAGFLLCCILFAAGNTICGLAQSKDVIILGRVAAGLGGGGLNSISTFIETDLISLRYRMMWQGFGNIVYGAGIGLGSVVGGFISGSLGWRWSFLMLTPLTIFTAIGVWWFVPGHEIGTEWSIWDRVRRVDLLGSLLLTAALILMLWALNFEWAGEVFSPTVVAIALPISGAIMVSFVLIEAYHAAEPIFPTFLLRSRSVTFACLASWFDSMAIYTLMFYVPLYLQLSGNTAQVVGVRLLPEPFGAVVGSLGSGLLMRVTGVYGILKVAALAIFLGGPIGFWSSTLDTGIALPELYLFLNGVGFGGTLTVLLMCVLAAVENDMRAIVAGMMYTFRSVGATIGVTLAGLVFRMILAARIARDGVDGSYNIGDLIKACSAGGSDHPACSTELLAVYAFALRAVFMLAFAFGLAGLVCGLFTSNFQLHAELMRVALAEADSAP